MVLNDLKEMGALYCNAFNPFENGNGGKPFQVIGIEIIIEHQKPPASICTPQKHMSPQSRQICTSVSSSDKSRQSRLYGKIRSR